MLPKMLKYGSKVVSAPAKSFRTQIAPQNGTGAYNNGDTIIFNIPTRSNLVLCPVDSYLKWTVQPFISNGASAIRWDKCGSHGLIQRIRVYHGSNLLQDLDSYGLLAKMMFDLQAPTDANYNKHNILCGTRNDLVVTTNATPITANAIAYANATLPLGNTTANIQAYLQQVLADLTATVPVTYLPALQVTSGEGIPLANGNIVTANTNVTAPITYCLNLMSLVGTMCPNNYLPLFAMTSAPLRVEIQLVQSPVQAFNTITLPSFAVGASAYPLVSNVEYSASMIELGDSAMQMIESSLEGQPLQFVYGDYRNYQYTYTIPTNATTQVNMPIPAKFSSLKSIYVAQRDQGTGAVTFFPFSSVNYGLSSYQFRTGAQIIPSKPVDDICSMFSELCKSVGSMSDLKFNPSIRKSSYQVSLSTANTVALEANNASNITSGSFYVGIDLENYTGAPKDTIFAGYNSNTDDIYFIGSYNTTAPSATNLTNYSGAQLNVGNPIRFDAYALFDVVFVCENGTAFVRY
jgi:hypothetical protein